MNAARCTTARTCWRWHVVPVEPPGFYGKAPALGDFVSRRLPSGFVTVWDAWLRSVITGSRAALGTEWLDAWNEAPVWQFGLGAGIVGPQPWFGVLIPSVDRVGRQFPFTILGAAAAGGVAHTSWSARVEALALGALEDEFDPACLAAELEALGAPTAPAEGELATLPAGQSWWCCRDAPRVPATVLRCAGLPLGDQAARLVAMPGYSAP